MPFMEDRDPDSMDSYLSDLFAAQPGDSGMLSFDHFPVEDQDRDRAYSPFDYPPLLRPQEESSSFRQLEMENSVLNSLNTPTAPYTPILSPVQSRLSSSPSSIRLPSLCGDDEREMSDDGSVHSSASTIDASTVSPMPTVPMVLESPCTFCVNGGERIQVMGGVSLQWDPYRSAFYITGNGMPLQFMRPERALLPRDSRSQGPGLLPAPYQAGEPQTAVARARRTTIPPPPSFIDNPISYDIDMSGNGSQLRVKGNGSLFFYSFRTRDVVVDNVVYKHDDYSLVLGEHHSFVKAREGRSKPFKLMNDTLRNNVLYTFIGILIKYGFKKTETSDIVFWLYHDNDYFVDFTYAEGAEVIKNLYYNYRRTPKKWCFLCSTLKSLNLISFKPPFHQSPKTPL